MVDHVSSTITIKSPHTAVMDVIADIARYPSWSEPIEQTEILSVTAEGRPGQARFHVKTFVGREEYVLAYTWVSPESVTWTLVEGKSMSQLDGSYTLRDLGDNTTEVRYDLEVELKIKVPGPLRRKAQEGLVNAALKDLKQEAER